VGVVFRLLCMSGYKPYPPAGPLLIGYDPYRDLPSDHLAWLVDEVVDQLVEPPVKALVAGQPERDPRLLLKVVLYSCLTGVHSSRRMAQNCSESLPYLLLVRDERPCHTSLANTRRSERALLRELFCRLRQLAAQLKMPFLGRIAIDSSKLSALASSDSVVGAKDYDKALAAFEAILSLVEETDTREDAEGSQVHVTTGVSQVQMRDLLRSMGKERKEVLKLSERMVARVEAGVRTLKAAKSEGLSHVSLTDPDARMMPVGIGKKQRMGHQLEAVTDGGNLLETHTGNNMGDGGRLLPLVELAEQVSEVPITQVIADTGYYSGGQVQGLLEAGIDVLVPDKGALREMRFGPAEEAQDCIEFTKIAGRNAYLCPEGNILKYVKATHSGGQRFLKYAATNECTSCPLASRCLKSKTAKRRNITIGEFRDALKAYVAKFADPEIRKAYMARGPAIETVFAVVRFIFGFDRWHVIGEEAIASEGALLSCAYQLKKIQVHLRNLGKTLKEALA
jgi:transposase